MNNPLNYDNLARQATPFGKIVVAAMQKHRLNIQQVVNALPLENKTFGAKRTFFRGVVLGIDKNTVSPHTRKRLYTRTKLTLVYLVPLAFVLKVPTATLYHAYSNQNDEWYVFSRCYMALDPMEKLAMLSILSSYGLPGTTQKEQLDNVRNFYMSLTGKEKATVDDTLQLWTNELIQTEEGRTRLASFL